MRRNVTAGMILVIAVCQLGCGYLQSGTWEDDPKNWSRAFRSTKPEDVVVLHSRYFRSPHFTFEFEYYFEIQQNGPLRRQLFTMNKLVRAGTIVAFDNAPAWFAPKAADAYDIWKYADEPDSNFRVVIDKSNGNMFLTDYQL